MVRGRQGEVDEAAVLGDVGAVNLVSFQSRRYCKGNLLNGDSVTSLGTEIVEQLCCALFSVGVFAERIDNPHLPEMDSSSESS